MVKRTPASVAQMPANAMEFNISWMVLHPSDNNSIELEICQSPIPGILMEPLKLEVCAILRVWVSMSADTFALGRISTNNLAVRVPDSVPRTQALRAEILASFTTADRAIVTWLDERIEPENLPSTTRLSLIDRSPRIDACLPIWLV
jgi:hypothetical protein